MKITKTQLREMIREELLNEAKLWQYFSEVSNTLSDLRTKGWLKQAEKQNPQLKSKVKVAEKMSEKLMLLLDDIADNLE